MNTFKAIELIEQGLPTLNQTYPIISLVLFPFSYSPKIQWYILYMLILTDTRCFCLFLYSDPFKSKTEKSVHVNLGKTLYGDFFIVELPEVRRESPVIHHTEGTLQVVSWLLLSQEYPGNSHGVNALI